MIESDCYCDPSDRAFYRTITLSSIIIWICILCGYAVISTFGHGHFIRFNEAKQDKRDKAAEKTFSNLSDMVETHEKSFRGKLSDIVSAKLLDYDYCKGIEDYYQHVYSQSTESNCNTSNPTTDAAVTTEITATTSTGATVTTDEINIVATKDASTITDPIATYEKPKNQRQEAANKMVVLHVQ